VGVGGQEDAFTAWAASRQQAMLRTAVLLTGNHHRAEDLVQEALTKVALRWARLQTEDPTAYARQIMVRDNISWWRRRRRDVLTDDVPEPPPAAAPDPDRALLVRNALRRLTNRQRTLLVLRFYEDLSVAQTAALMGTSQGTVKSQTHVALRRLRELAPELRAELGDLPEHSHENEVTT
jgi:RNA polymerase sigma-70 factor (sigma-E family)